MPRIASVLEMQMKKKEYLLYCISFACCWNNQKRFLKPIFSLHYPALPMQVIGHSEKISLSKQHPVKIENTQTKLINCQVPFAMPRALLENQLVHIPKSTFY